MVEILHNKNLATKFQILAQIADSGPSVQQRDIAQRLQVTPQAISDYIGQLVKDGLLTIEDHSKYKVTNEGVNWIIKELKEIKEYSDFVVKSVTNISISAAIAGSPLVKGQEVGLVMKNGLLTAIDRTDSSCKGIACSDALNGEDVGIKKIEGIVELEFGKVTIVKVPVIQNGGSRKVDFNRLKDLIKGKFISGAIGIESLAALNKIDASSGICSFGVKEAVVESAQHGISTLVVCVEGEISGLIKRLEEANINYEIQDIQIK